MARRVLLKVKVTQAAKHRSSGNRCATADELAGEADAKPDGHNDDASAAKAFRF